MSSDTHPLGSGRVRANTAISSSVNLWPTSESMMIQLDAEAPPPFPWPDKAWRLVVTSVDWHRYAYNSEEETGVALYNALRRFIGPLPTYQLMLLVVWVSASLSGLRRGGTVDARPQSWPIPLSVSRDTKGSAEFLYKHSEIVDLFMTFELAGSMYSLEDITLLFSGTETSITDPEEAKYHTPFGIGVHGAQQLLSGLTGEQRDSVRLGVGIADQKTNSCTTVTARELFTRYEAQLPAHPYCRYRKFAGAAPLRERNWQVTDQYSLIGAAK